jgi:hypothetical protein
MTAKDGIRLGGALAIAAMLALPAPAEEIGGAFEKTGTDVVTRFFHTAGPLPNGHVLVGGGMTFQLLPPSLISLDDLSFYDPDAGTFTATFAPLGGGDPVVPTLAVPRSSHTQTALADGRVLFTGGRTGASGSNPGSPVDSVEVFDPNDGSVTTGPAMSAPRSAHTATRLPDGRVVVAGGSTWQTFDPDAGKTGAWSTAKPLARTRTSHAAVLLPDALGPGQAGVLLVAGSGSGGATMEIIDPDGDAVLCTSALVTAIDDVAATRLDDGTVLIVGGQDLSTGDTVDDTYLYRPALDELAMIDPPPGTADGIADHELVAFGRFALVCGGEQQVDGVDCELDYAALYDRAGARWIDLPTMHQPRDDLASALLPGPRILLIDGGMPFIQTIPSDTAELFVPDPARPADLDGDGLVDVRDLVILLSAWGPCPPEKSCGADLDGDGVVDVRDLVILLSAWGPCE